jgi:hypothetical protein
MTKKKKKVPEKEPDTPWRRVNLKELVIPESAKEAAKNITPAVLHVSVRVKKKLIKCSTWQIGIAYFFPISKLIHSL